MKEDEHDGTFRIGPRLQVLGPIWTLVPKDEDPQLSRDLRFRGTKSA